MDPVALPVRDAGWKRDTGCDDERPLILDEAVACGTVNRSVV